MGDENVIYILILTVGKSAHCMQQLGEWWVSTSAKFSTQNSYKVVILALLLQRCHYCLWHFLYLLKTQKMCHDNNKLKCSQSWMTFTSMSTGLCLWECYHGTTSPNQKEGGLIQLNTHAVHTANTHKGTSRSFSIFDKDPSQVYSEYQNFKSSYHIVIDSYEWKYTI